MAAPGSGTWAASTPRPSPGMAASSRWWSPYRPWRRCSSDLGNDRPGGSGRAGPPRPGLYHRRQMRPLHVATVWHMHQPYYKDDLTATYLLPWARLRSCKDYYKMVALLDGYPSIKQNFNLVPSLLAQIEDYARGDYQDLFLNLSQRPAEDLTP